MIHQKNAESKMKKLLLLLLLPILTFAQPNCVPTTIVINLDQYQSETAWAIYDTGGNMLTYGQGYDSQPTYASVVEQRCLPQGDLTFVIYDSYGDGINGALWGGLDGSYYLIQCNDTLIYGTDAAFGYDTTHVFVSDACPPVLGCMDPAYVEFNPLADTDDGSCTTLKIFGCIDSTMYNYDPTANTMALIPNCDYVLTLYDLIGDGWVGSYLEVTQDTNVYQFWIDTTAYTQDFIINLKSPMPVEFRFYVTSQAQLTTPHCGFKLTNPLGNTIIEVLPPFIQPMYKYKTPTYCGNLCIEKIFGCMDTLAINYIDTANTDDGSCYYMPGCTNSSFLEYYTQGFVADYNNGDCQTEAIWGCTDSTAFNYNAIANLDNGGCLPVIIGCMQPLAFNYNPNANTADTCIAVVYGCMSDIALNYNPLANTDDGSCIGVVYGCMDPDAFNYDPVANVDDSSCIEIVYGCMDATAFNYDPIANIDNGNCIPFVYGCTDSIMFNYDPTANTDNGSCIPYIYGCTDPSMLNYNPEANTEDFSCIAYIYGCMDSTALNFDSLANTDNGSCIEIVMGCMDPNAYSYEPAANVNDSLSCLYSAGCITGPGNPYWLNDPCYAWVLSVDNYCCENAWDTICQSTYDYCTGTWSGPVQSRYEQKKLVAVTDLLGRPSKIIENKVLLYIYSDGTVKRKLITK